MRFQIGDIVVRKGDPLWLRSIIEKTYGDRMTVRNIRWGDISTNCKQENFVLCPYYPTSAVIKRAKETVRSDKVFQIGGRKYLALSSKLLPNVMIQIFITEGLLAEPGSLGGILYKEGKTYKEFCKEMKGQNRKVPGPTAYLYEAQMSIEEYQWRW